MKKRYEYDETVSVKMGEQVPIRIMEGTYKDLVYQYGTIKFIEDGDNLRCNFTYNVIDNPSEVVLDQELIDYLGDILVEVMNDEMQETEEDFLREVELSDSENN